MENDSPNLFDSEPVTVELTTVAENVDDVLAEFIDEINGKTATGDAENIIEDGNEVHEGYHTDESDDKNEDEEFVDDQLENTDKSIDHSIDQQEESSKTKHVNKGLPPGRVKLIMKMDPDVNIIASDAVFLLTKATESFIGLLAQHCHKAMVASKKKHCKKNILIL